MKIKKFIRKNKYKIRDIFNKNAIKLSWAVGTNFGDAINPILINKITKKKVLWVNPKHYKNDYLMCIGSRIRKATSNALIWGTGYISHESKFRSKPKKVYAVRGPLTREKLLSQDVDCPEVYGDPALLLPRIYNPKIQKRYKLGVIPHYVDKQHPNLELFYNNEDILIMDIKMPNHFEFIDNVLSCEKIISSSLHGLIVADAYDIPSVWIELSNNLKGDGFKFIDYFLSVKRVDKKPLIIDKNISLKALYSTFNNYKIDIDLSLLIKACPYEIELK